MSLRRTVARPAGVPELNEAVAKYELSSLPADIKAALRLADGFLADPSPTLIRSASPEHFTSVQVVEIVLKLVSFSSDKAAVALGLDAPADPNGLSEVRYENGVAVVTPAALEP